MANVVEKYGLRPVRKLDGSPFINAQNRYRITANYGTPIFQGDLVSPATDGTITRAVANTSFRIPSALEEPGCVAPPRNTAGIFSSSRLASHSDLSTVDWKEISATTLDRVLAKFRLPVTLCLQVPSGRASFRDRSLEPNRPAGDRRWQRRRRDGISAATRHVRCSDPRAGSCAVRRQCSVHGQGLRERLLSRCRP